MGKDTFQYDIAVIGAGSGGLVVASAAAGMGARALLVESRKMGGDCLNYGCVPSKTFLKSAHLAHKMKTATEYGIHNVSFDVSMQDIMKRVSDVIAEIEPHDSKERFESLGVTVVMGFGKLVEAHTIDVDGTIYTAKKIVIATGSTAFIPPIKGLDTVKYYTNESVFELDTLPKRMVVLGAGPIGLELGQGFAHLGSEVHMVTRDDKIFSKDEPEAFPIMAQAMENDGVKIYTKSEIKEVLEKDGQTAVVISAEDGEKELLCDVLLVALGRRPNTDNMNLENIGIAINKRGFIEVNEYLQTTVDNIYACGDVRGKFLFTHSAGYEASMVVRNALVAPKFKTSYHNIAWTTYTMPEVAQVGLLEAQAKEQGVHGYTYILPISNNDRAKADDDRQGYVKVVLDKKSRVIGAGIVSEKAGDLLPVLSLLVTKRMKIGGVMSVIYQYPVQGEIVKSVALEHFKQTAKAWQKALLKKIVRR